jgi:hypothetical protein
MLPAARVFLVVAVLAAAAPLAAQCPMCKSVVESSDVRPFNRAILVMMAGPYLVVGALGVVLFRDRVGRAVRRLQERAQGSVSLRGRRGPSAAARSTKQDAERSAPHSIGRALTPPRGR